ncbi:MAG TPA: hypothetical protein VNO30_23175 [Kofleriaceae bacterium]|nr:hypothetical protein [Kofleriaceae bacterium]
MGAAALAAIAWLSGCGGTPQAPAQPRSQPAASDRGATARPAEPDPDLNRPPPRKLLAINWEATQLASEADALAVWAQIAPTGQDWEEKLDEVPAAAARPLAVALLRGGNFVCVAPPPPIDCARPVFDLPEPAHAAGFTDPCLRRLLALWSVAQLEPDDLSSVNGAGNGGVNGGVRDALRAIVAIPPPESQLVAAALRAVPDRSQDELLALIAIATRAGQRDLASAAIGRLDEAHLIEATSKHHLDVALEVLSAQGHRAAYLAAVTDESMATRARTQAIADLLAADAADDAAPRGKLAPDLQAALVKAAAARDCTVAATAARALALRGDRRFVPSRPRTRSSEVMLRALCVLASYEQLVGLQGASEPSLLAAFVPPKGLERTVVVYDALSDVDDDGDGDPHTRRTIDLVPRAEVALPEQDDLVRAMQRCTGTSCKSADREFRFAWKSIGGELWLSRIEVIDRPPCP